MDVTVHDKTLVVSLLTPEDVAEVLDTIMDDYRIGSSPKLNHFAEHPEGCAFELVYDREEFAQDAAQKVREIDDSTSVEIE